MHGLQGRNEFRREYTSAQMKITQTMRELYITQLFGKDKLYDYTGKIQ